MEIITSKGAPAAIGPYSQAVAVNGLVYTSGQLALLPETGEMVEGGVARQTEQLLENLRAVLAAAGCGLGDVVKTTCFLADMGDFAAFNEVYARYFPGKPARSCVAVRALPKGALAEVEAVAHKK